MGKNIIKQPIKKKFNKKLIIILIIFLFLIIIAISSLLILKNVRETNSNKQNTEIEKTIDAYNKAQEVSDKARMISSSDGIDKAIELYDSEIKDTNDSDQKYALKISEALFMTKNDMYNESLLILADLPMNRTTASMMADIYGKIGDNDNAILYFKKVIELLDKNSPTYDYDNNYYKQVVDELEASK